jgi:hypothetical protein
MQSALLRCLLLALLYPSVNTFRAFISRGLSQQQQQQQQQQQPISPCPISQQQPIPYMPFSTYTSLSLFASTDPTDTRDTYQRDTYTDSTPSSYKEVAERSLNDVRKAAIGLMAVVGAAQKPGTAGAVEKVGNGVEKRAVGYEAAESAFSPMQVCNMYHNN